MTQQKKTETEKKIGNWTCQLIGTAILFFQTYKYFTDSLGDPGFEIVVFGLAILLIFAPFIIAQYVKKKLNRNP